MHVLLSYTGTVTEPEGLPAHPLNALESDRWSAAAFLGRNVLEHAVWVRLQEGQTLALHLHLINRLHASSVAHCL